MLGCHDKTPQCIFIENNPKFVYEYLNKFGIGGDYKDKEEYQFPLHISQVPVEFMATGNNAATQSTDNSSNESKNEELNDYISQFK